MLVQSNELLVTHDSEARIVPFYFLRATLMHLITKYGLAFVASSFTVSLYLLTTGGVKGGLVVRHDLASRLLGSSPKLD